MSETVEIPVAAGTLPAQVLRPADQASAPGLVVVPSIFGPAPDLLDRLADVGDTATVVVPDPFWRTGEGALGYGQREEAFARLAEFDVDACRDEMAAAVEWARANGNGKVIGLGICFGGPFVNRMAAAGLLDGIVTWHGSRMEQSLDGVGSITCPVRHHLGSEDPISPPEAIEAIADAFAATPDTAIVVHDGATHGFSHDGAAFDPEAYALGHASVVELLDTVR